MANKQKREIDFIKGRMEKHGNFYDYSKSVFTRWDDNVEIICPDHGSFWQSPRNHITCGSGCIKCGYEKTRQRLTKNDDWNEMKRIVNDVIKNLNGKFPTQDYVQSHNLSDVKRVILKLGGYTLAQEKFGFIPRQKCKKYWMMWEHVENFLKENFPHLIETGQCPTTEMMRNSGEDPSSFLRHFGGIEGICKKLNLVPSKGYKTRDGHFVRSYYELLVDEYLYSRGIDHEPEIKPFKKYGYRCDQKIGNLYLEIWGYCPRAKKYHAKRLKKEKLYKSHNLTLISINETTFNGRPTDVEKRLNILFAKFGLNTNPIRNYLWSDIAKQVGYPWTEEIIVAKIKEYIKKYNEFPTQKKMCKLGYYPLNNNIGKFGGFQYFRKLMGVGKWIKSNLKWSEGLIVERLKKLFNQLGRFPKDEDLSSDLRNAIRKCSYVESHDLNYYRDKLGCEITKKSNGYWTDENIIKSLIKIYDETGLIIPSNNQLILMKKNSLSRAIQKKKFSYWRARIKSIIRST